MRMIGALFAALPLWGCSLVPGSDAYKFEQAKAEIQRAGYDGASMQFSSMHMSDDRGLICGEVNAKNIYGAYSGITQFAVTADEPRRLWVMPTTLQLQIDPAHAGPAVEKFPIECL